MSIYTGKKILVLGGAFQHCKVVEAIHELGAVAYVTDYLEDSPAKKIADKYFDIDVKDIDGLVKLCEDEQVDGAIAISLDPCQIPYQKLCDKMGYPCFGNQEQFFVLTNKKAFKECCKKYDVSVIQEYCVNEIDDYENVKYPVMVKPVDSRGSRGQTICYKKEDMGCAVTLAKKEATNGDIIVEKYMGGYEDFTISYLIIDGEPNLIRTGDRYQGSKQLGLNNIAIAATSPSKYSDVFIKNTHEKLIKMLKGIGLKNAPVFIQGFIDEDKVRFYDPGLRFSGGEYERLLKKIVGVDIIKMLVEFAITGSIENMTMDKALYKLKNKKIMQLCPTLKDGIITKIVGEEKIKSNKDVITYSPRYSLGEYISYSNNVSRRFAEICIISENEISERQNIEFIQKSLHVYDENGEDMICDLFDVNKLGR